jgi:hypothetical protein
VGIRLVKYGLQNGAGTYYHNEMKNRDLEDQHPITSITGLPQALESIGQDIEAAMDHNNMINRELADQHPISAIAGLAKALEDVKFTAQDTKSLNLDYNSTTKILTGDVLLSKQQNNGIIIAADGLYVKNEASCNVVKINQVAHGFVDLQVVYMNSAGKYTLASSAAANTSEAVGVVRNIDVDNFELVTDGLYTTTAVAFAKGSTLFLSTTGTLVTDIVDAMKIIKPIGTVAPLGVSINIQNGFLKDDFNVYSVYSGTYTDQTLNVYKYYSYGSVVDFEIDVPYNKFKLRGFVIEMGRSYETGSIPNRDKYAFSIRNSALEVGSSTNIVPYHTWTSENKMGFYTDATAYDYGDLFEGFNMPTSVPGFLYEDFDGTYKIHLRIWCLGGSRYGESSGGNTINFIKTFIQAVEE